MQQHFIPPVNFALILPRLYRSGQPTDLSFPFLETLRLKTILFLAPEDPSAKFLNFVDDQGISLIHLGMNGGDLNAGNSWDPIGEDVVLEALEYMLDEANYPLMVM